MRANWLPTIPKLLRANITDEELLHLRWTSATCMWPTVEPEAWHDEVDHHSVQNGSVLEACRLYQLLVLNALQHACLLQRAARTAHWPSPGGEGGSRASTRLIVVVTLIVVRKSRETKVRGTMDAVNTNRARIGSYILPSPTPMPPNLHTPAPPLQRLLTPAPGAPTCHPYPNHQHTRLGHASTSHAPSTLTSFFISRRPRWLPMDD